tara:strand:+ start:29503 stop:29688 length:186 start_codon:yes stop_codon:yes gene_type:complete
MSKKRVKFTGIIDIDESELQDGHLSSLYEAYGWTLEDVVKDNMNRPTTPVNFSITDAEVVE